MCNEVGAKTDVHIGFSRSNPENRWKRMDSYSVENFSFEWHQGHPKNDDFLQLRCIKNSQFGKVWDYIENSNYYFICQYY